MQQVRKLLCNRPLASLPKQPIRQQQAMQLVCNLREKGVQLEGKSCMLHLPVRATRNRLP